MEEKGNERWSAAIDNLSKISNNFDSLHHLLNKKAVYVDEETFNKASLTSDQARTIKVLEQRVETLERELDAAISAAARARTEKRQAEAGQKSWRTQQKCLNCTWKNCERSKTRFRNGITRLNF
ncbi:hypothetical protein L1987_31987 [Smallanthus sonchifolius]|uniref:Uncharacterized protein n=1 Tax=Smallanthus sonchifolius TaxID=185202 RepID=A0ACB9I8Y8_9ASTR|nr:hypothetical protein L1987_31987 [Smallanthus sonchifolius]